MYEIEIAPAAQADLLVLRAFDRARILAAASAELGRHPMSVARHRKMLHDVRPSWEHVPPLWQLRVGDFRVFYDVDAQGKVVYIRRVIRKGTRTTGEIV